MVAPIIGRGPDTAGRVNTGSPEPRSAAKTAEARSGSEQAQQIRTPADAINVLRVRMEQRLQQAMGGQPKPATASDKYAAQAQPPTAAEVASTILGFVQNRLQEEADAGADVERLADLLSQARAGIEQGYAEAREQIQALGMMNDTLAGEIDDGFNRIQDGLLDLEKLFLDKDSE
jgi:hypothetical protein